MYKQGLKMSQNYESYFDCCLYFTVNTLSRLMTKMADDVFQRTGLSPSHAFLLMLVNETPGITVGQAAKKLNFAPSTLTRFADKLVVKKLLTKESKGKHNRLFPTRQAIALYPPIQEAWQELYKRYCDLLGEEFAGALTANTAKANQILNEKVEV
jgi:DNA-binding MarR family transcriptional regulator